MLGAATITVVCPGMKPVWGNGMNLANRRGWFPSDASAMKPVWGNGMNAALQLQPQGWGIPQ